MHGQTKGEGGRAVASCPLNTPLNLQIFSTCDSEAIHSLYSFIQAIDSL